MRTRPIVLCAALVVALALGGGCAHEPVPVAAPGAGSAAAAGDPSRSVASARSPRSTARRRRRRRRRRGRAHRRVCRGCASIACWRASPRQPTTRRGSRPGCRNSPGSTTRRAWSRSRTCPVDRTATLRQELAAEGLAPLAPAALLAGCADALGARDLATAAGPASGCAPPPSCPTTTTTRCASSVPIRWPRCRSPPACAGYEDETRAVYALPLSALPVRGRLERYVPRAAPPLVAGGRARRARRAPAPIRCGSPLPTRSSATRCWPRSRRCSSSTSSTPTTGSGDRAATKATKPSTSTPRSRCCSPAPRRRASATTCCCSSSTPRGSRRDGRATRWTRWPDASTPLVWRVTLAPDGVPLLYDSIHACGCYQLFFPTERLALRTLPPSIDEGALAPQAPVALLPGARIELRIESGTPLPAARRHRARERGSPANLGSTVWRPKTSLRTLPRAEGGTRSLYAPDGLVPGTERGERFVFWPMGIASAGAMRQWGRHATAFVGRRHFDEATLIERYFVLVPAPGAGHRVTQPPRRAPRQAPSRRRVSGAWPVPPAPRRSAAGRPRR